MLYVHSDGYPKSGVNDAINNLSKLNRMHGDSGGLFEDLDDWMLAGIPCMYIVYNTVHRFKKYTHIQ